MAFLILLTVACAPTAVATRSPTTVPAQNTPFGTRTFFVTDFPSARHERVTSHEIGHILGLHHVLDNANRLMYSGTNGMALSAEEIAVARYAAQGLLDGLR